MISQYDEKTKTLSYRYRIPNEDEICVIDRFVYDEESGQVIAKELDKTHAKKSKDAFTRDSFIALSGKDYLFR